MAPLRPGSRRSSSGRSLAIASMLALALIARTTPGRAVIVLDGTWKANGGGRGHESAGFGPFLALAAQPQFDPLFSFGEADDPGTFGSASGTWIGNDGAHGYLLTAGHVFSGTDPGEYVYRSKSGRVYHADKLFVQPRWNGDLEDRTGFDATIVRLTEPVAGPGEPAQPARLYAGRAELGLTVVIVGYGSRGIGSVGEADRFDRDSEKAAAENIVEDLLPASGRSKGDAGNWFSVTLKREDGGVPNPLGGRSTPVSPLEGVLGSGDSGGSTWAKIDGEWVVVGINSNGTGADDVGEKYGDVSSFVRVSGLRAWIAATVPTARFLGADGSAEGTLDAERLPASPERQPPTPVPLVTGIPAWATGARPLTGARR